ncbi:hypothetical protein [Nocardia sp. NPDC006630]|uniref:hypothetical protein n=1 Tax=Nocardia sp. NPDC006630 TaxID=3157181 RepID=UPI0033B8165C
MTTDVADGRSAVLQTQCAPSGNGSGHYWTVQLYCPPGASVAAKHFIGLAQTAVQTAVDLLGRGTTQPPPAVDDLMTTVVFGYLGEGTTTTDYQQALAAVESRQSALLALDGQVLQVSDVMQSGKDSTLTSIQHVVTQLNVQLHAVGTGKLTSAKETVLMQQVAAAVEQVYDKVTTVAADNARMAGGSSGSSGGSGGSDPTGSSDPTGNDSGVTDASYTTPVTSGTAGAGTTSAGTSGSSDGGSGGLGSILEMLPMMAIPLITAIVPELLKSNDKNDKHDSDAKQDQGPGDQQATNPGAAKTVTGQQTTAPQQQPGAPQQGAPIPAGNPAGDPQGAQAAAT